MASDFWDASSVERILSSAAATSSSSFSSSPNFSSSVVGIFDTADLATTGDVLSFLLHHPVSKRKESKKTGNVRARRELLTEIVFLKNSSTHTHTQTQLLTAAAASFAVFAIPRLVKAIAKNFVLPVAALGTLLVVLAAPEASLSLARGLFSFVAAHPVACSALILAAACVALSPYLLLAAAVLALAWGVPRLPAPLRPQFFPAPIAAEARATLESAKEKLDSYLVDGGGGETAKSAAAATAAAAKEAARELEKIKQAVALPARSTAAAVSRAAGRAKAATSAVKAAVSAGAQAIGEVGRCRSEPTAAERAACVRQQEAELLDREGGKWEGEESRR